MNLIPRYGLTCPALGFRTKHDMDLSGMSGMSGIIAVRGLSRFAVGRCSLLVAVAVGRAPAALRAAGAWDYV